MQEREKKKKNHKLTWHGALTWWELKITSYYYFMHSLKANTMLYAAGSYILAQGLHKIGL